MSTQTLSPPLVQRQLRFYSGMQQTSLDNIQRLQVVQYHLSIDWVLNSDCNAQL